MDQSPMQPSRDCDPHEIIPLFYVSLKRTQACSCCNRVHEYCELYAYAEYRTPWGLGKVVENLRRVSWPRYNLRIEQWEDTKSTILPFCHDCHEPSLHMSLDMIEPPPATVVWMGGYRDPVLAALLSKPDRLNGSTTVRKVPTPAPASSKRKERKERDTSPDVLARMLDL